MKRQIEVDRFVDLSCQGTCKYYYTLENRTTKEIDSISCVRDFRTAYKNAVSEIKMLSHGNTTRYLIKIYELGFDKDGCYDIIRCVISNHIVFPVKFPSSSLIHRHLLIFVRKEV